MSGSEREEVSLRKQRLWSDLRMVEGVTLGMVMDAWNVQTTVSACVVSSSPWKRRRGGSTVVSLSPELLGEHHRHLNMVG